MLLALAIGDAYGAGFEYAEAEFVQAFNTLSGYVQHPWHRLEPGSYTDDTQMSLAIAELLVAGTDWTPLNITTKFVEVFKRDPREGYSRRFYKFLREVESGTEFLAQIQPHSDKSGAAMRAAPLGVLPTVDEVIERCRVQAAITHNTPNGITAALASALMAHYCIYQLGPKSELGEFLNEHTDRKWSRDFKDKVGSKGWMSAHAALTAVRRNATMQDLLRDCVAFTGDVDTVATMALAAGSCSAEIEQNLPDHLIAGLENGPYGRDYLVALDAQLMALANGQR